MPLDQRHLTPPKLARRWGCKPETVIGLIRSGELQAIDLARPGSLRPRYRISPEAIADFERRRSASPMPDPVRARRSRSGVKSFV